MKRPLGKNKKKQKKTVPVVPGTIFLIKYLSETAPLQRQAQREELFVIPDKRGNERTNEGRRRNKQRRQEKKEKTRKTTFYAPRKKIENFFLLFLLFSSTTNHYSVTTNTKLLF